jgi:hypothetical protein
MATIFAHGIMYIFVLQSEVHLKAYLYLDRKKSYLKT